MVSLTAPISAHVLSSPPGMMGEAHQKMEGSSSPQK